MSKKQRRFVPRAILTAACAGAVVPFIALDGCGGSTTGGTGVSGIGPDGAVGVAAGGFGGGGGRGSGGRGAGGAIGMAGGAFTVGVQAFGGTFGMAGGAFGVAAGAFGGVAAAGFRGTGGVAAGGFGGLSVANLGFGGTNPIRDAGPDAPAKPQDASTGGGGHASRDPDRASPFGELSSARSGENPSTKVAARRRRT